MTEQKSTAASDLPRLCELLEQKIAIFKGFMSATTSLKDMIEQHNVEAVEMLIIRRHNLMAYISKLDAAISRIRESNPSYEAPETRKRIQSLMATLEQVINKTQRLNKDCEVAAEDELDKLKNDLSGIANSQTWFKGYRGKSGESRFLDVKT
ncbi:MAG TPA: hypothetical protein VMT12_04070 [Syntrophales bacterium]|nr:hypothetical protein [Syntrophales bacterium]